MRRAIALLGALALVAAACGSDTSGGAGGEDSTTAPRVLDEGELAPPEPVDEAAVQAALADARAVWDAAGLDDYTLTVSFEESGEEFGGPGVQPPCGVYGGPLVILVSGAEVSEAVDKFSGCEVDITGLYFADKPLTMEAMFTFIDDNAARVVVEYDSESGAPRSFGYEDDSGFFHVSVSAVGEGDFPPGGDVVAEAEAQRAIWEAAGIDDYRLTISTQCFCPPESRDPYTVTVAAGSVVSVLRDGMPLQRTPQVLTVADLFDLVVGHRYADRLDVMYATLGYPRRVEVDPSLNAADEEITYIAEVAVG